MKFSTQVLIIGLVATGLVFATPTANLNESSPKVGGIIEDLINATINTIVHNLTEPIAIDALTLNFTDELLNGRANLSAFALYGLKALAASQIQVNILSLAMNATIKIPKIKLDTKYFADVTLLEFIPLYGNGRVGVNVDKIDLLVTGRVNITHGLSISNATVSFGVGEISFDLHGLLNNEELSVLISTALNDSAGLFINQNRKAISDLISPVAQEIINAILKGNSTVAQTEKVREAIRIATLKL